MNNEQWKQELQGLKLTTQQKQRMKRKVQGKNFKRDVKSCSWSWLVAPSFVGLLGFCVLLFFTDAPISQMQQQASLPPNILEQADHTNYFKIHTRLNLVIGILILLNGFIAMLTIVRTKRWQGSRINKVRQNIIKRRYILLFLACSYLYSVVVALYEFQVSEQIKGIMIYVCLQSIVLLLILYSARNQADKVCCPHCQHELSKKEKRKLMTRLTIQIHCQSCGGKLFYAKKTRKVSGIIQMLFLALLLLPTSFGIPFWLTLSSTVILYSIGLFYLLPLFLELEGEEKPLF